MPGTWSSKKSKHPETIDEVSLIELDDDNLNHEIIKNDTKRRQSIIPSPYLPKLTDVLKMSDNGSNSDDTIEENDFDTFILNNFNPFSGSEDVTQWLDDTEQKFNSQKISRNLRYTAIPLLVKGEAKRRYIQNRNDMKSFDDFYEFLLTNYDVKECYTRPLKFKPRPYIPNPNNTPHIPLTRKNISFDDHRPIFTDEFELTNNIPLRPILRSTAIGDIGPTSIIDDGPEQQSTLAPSNVSYHNSNLDQTTYVIHKAIIDNLIKNPKTFQGGKEDVKQWLDDIEQLFDTAQIPDNHKLDLIPYSLRGEARRWYKNTKASLTSWPIFVKELKEAFLSPFHDELAFKKLESYAQGINQPVRSFYNEVLKLCNETDPDMSESMKLRHLLKKAKPTLQYEIRKQKPTTTKQFLEYAKESEELLQLSNIEIDDDKYNRNNTNPTNAAPSTTPQPKGWDYNNPYKNNRFGDYRNAGYNPRLSQPFNPPRPFNPNFRRDNSSYPTNQPSNYDQGFYPKSNRPNYDPRPSPSNQQPKSPYPFNKNRNRPNSPKKPVNNITIAQEPSFPKPTPLMDNTDFCTQCGETGHQASACPSF